MLKNKKFFLKKYKLGFTLSQMLIVITVLGILAAIVVPVLTKNTQNQAYVAGLKRTYSELDEATRAIMANNQGSMVGAVGTGSNSMRNAYMSYLNYIKSCDSGSSGCWYAGTSTWHILNGGSGWYDNTLYAQLILNDGTFLLFVWADSSCAYSGANKFVRNGNNELCGNIYIDVNGNKGPNIIGRDIFGFDVTKYALYPRGNNFDVSPANWTNECITTAAGDTYNGNACADRVIQEGDMNY